MSLQRLPSPPNWSAEQLEEARKVAIARFVQQRLDESVDEYRGRFEQCAAIVRQLFARTDDLQRFAAADLVAAPHLMEAARFLCAPPVSADDLNSLCGYRVTNRRTIATAAADAAVTVLRALFDPLRLAWLAEQRAPTDEERTSAIAWTAGIWASELQRTSRRTTASHRQEEAVVSTLVEVGFSESPRRSIQIVDDLPRGTFCHEALLDGAKCDVPVRLADGRLLAIECKDSNSGTNSVKRLIRESGGKARAWRNAFGQQVLPTVVLSGVYKLNNLLEAQADYGIAIFWEHELEPLKALLLRS